MASGTTKLINTMGEDVGVRFGCVTELIGVWTGTVDVAGCTVFSDKFATEGYCDISDIMIADLGLIGIMP